MLTPQTCPKTIISLAEAFCLSAKLSSVTRLQQDVVTPPVAQQLCGRPPCEHGFATNYLLY